ncbi:TolC family protein [Pelagicoccus sp. SDUM812003]|uniref:TolC family protein n=1 Tax=Pelagicoccus sp. SDUM812003 TaxID=3041267 RepID=UPI0028107BA4|nr:TolC family protein [Pelagicoccus sp. SDUM812003]MDQ8201877.1 TolC family protein [Pelagicoccus sp. SDUM812003]
MASRSSIPPEQHDDNGAQRPYAKAAVLAVLAFSLSACMTTPPPRTESLLVEVPDDFSSSGQSEAVASFEPSGWMEDFDDPLLSGLIEEALRYNLDLKVAAARLDAALASANAGKSEIWPSLNLSGNGSKSRRGSASGIQQTPTAETYGLTGRFSWEIDLWGKLRNGYRAELADQEAALADYRSARLSLAARTAKAWYAAIEADQQLELEKRILEALVESSRIVEENFASGIARALDVRLVRANLASSRSSLEQRRRSRDAAIRNLETILGRYPKNELELASELPGIRAEMPEGIPSELLLRRPDIVAAERRLAAAEQRKFEESKARLPSLDLNLSRGTSSSDLDEIFDFVEKRIWSQSLGVAQTLFQGGRLKANYQRARATYEQNVAAYSQTVLTAFREVENALSNQSSYREDYEYLRVAAEESIEAEKLAWSEYASGLTDITTVLDSVRRSITAQRSFIQVANQRIQSRIDLYLALGGGFEA